MTGASDVVLTLTNPGAGDEVEIDQTQLTFTNLNWSDAQTVTVTGVDDDVADGDQDTIITVSVNDGSSDDLFDPLPDQTVTVRTIDDE